MVPFRSDFTSTSATPGSLAPFGAPATSSAPGAPAASGFADVLQTLSRQTRASDVDSDEPKDAPGAPANAAGDTPSNEAAAGAPGSPDSHSRSARHHAARGKSSPASSTPGAVGATITDSQNNAPIAAMPGDRHAKARQQKPDQNGKSDTAGVTAPVPPAIVTDFTQTPKNPTTNWPVPGSTPANDAAPAAVAVWTEPVAEKTNVDSRVTDANTGRVDGSRIQTPAAATTAGAAKSSSTTASGNVALPLDTIDIADPALESATPAASTANSTGAVPLAADNSSVASAGDRPKAGRSLWATTNPVQGDAQKAATLAAIAQLGAGLDASAGDASAATSDQLAALLTDPTPQTASNDDSGEPLANLLGAVAATGRNQNAAPNAAIARALASAANGWTSSTSPTAVTSAADILKSASSAPLNADALRAAADNAATSLSKGVVSMPMPDLLSSTARAFAPPAIDGATALPPETDTAPAVSQIVQSMRVQALSGGGEAHISLQPGYLGGVTVTVRVDQDTVTASVSADTPAVREALRSQESTLRQTLGEQGLRLDRFEVTEPSQTPRRNPNGGDRSPADEQPRPRAQKRRDPSAPAFEFVA